MLEKQFIRLEILVVSHDETLNQKPCLGPKWHDYATAK
jgi:hypothetical protein